MSGRAPIVTSIVVDFDGTICEQDVSEELLPGGPAAGFRFGNAHPECVGCGTCKMQIVQRSRANGPVAFVGEGHTDRYGALFADVVFAKKDLPGICRADGVPFIAWETFDDVR